MMSDNDKMLSGKLVEETMRIRELEHKNIGPSVMAGDIDDDILVDIMAMCRRRFKKDDILVVVDLSEEENETGIVFTGTELHYWDNSGAVITTIRYENIEAVDFDEDSVLIQHSGEKTTIWLGDNAEEEKYPRYMYNYIMDILEICDVEMDSESLHLEKDNSKGSLLSMLSGFNGVVSNQNSKRSTDKTLNMIMREVDEGVASGSSSEDIAISIYNQLKDDDF